MFATLLLLASLLPGATTLQGTVRAVGSREPIAHARVHLPDLGREVATDQHGYFVVTGIPEGTWRVRAHALGYRPHEATILSSGAPTVRVELELEPSPVELPAIRIVAGAAAEREADTGAMEVAGPSQIRLSAGAMDQIPALAEADVFRALQTLPSVAAASDFSSALYIRGGAPDQNLVLLDGAPLFNPFHLGGIFAAIDPDAVAEVALYPGALPTRAGDRLSSTIEIWTREGGRDRVRAHGGIGLVSSRLGVDGPLPGGRGSYLVSGRRTYVDLASQAARAVGLIDESLPYAFSDLHLKLTHDVGELGHLAASVYLDQEGMHDPVGESFFGGSDWAWGSRMLSLRYRQPWRESWVAEVRAAASGFGARLDEPSLRNARSRMQDVLFGVDLSRRGSAHHLQMGAQLDRYTFRHRFENMTWGGEDIDPFVPSLARADRVATLAAYLEDRWTPVAALSLRAGARVLHAGGRGTAWMPRLGARLALTPRLSLSAGGGRYAQAVHTLRNEEAKGANIFAYDILGAAERSIGLPTADDVVAGVEWSAEASSLRVDGYAKRMWNLALQPLPSELSDARVFVGDGYLPGTGSARGLEVTARHARGRSALTAAYALAFTSREVEGTRYTPRFERRHRLDLSGVTSLGARGQISARLARASGQPFTPALGWIHPYGFDPRVGGVSDNPNYSGDLGSDVVLLGRHNSERLPGYFRLDVAGRRSFQPTWFGRKVEFTPYFQILNVLNTHNVFWSEPAPDPSSGALTEHSWQFPILPSFGIEWQS